MKGKGALGSALVVIICVGAFVHLNLGIDNAVSAEEGTKAQALPWAMFRGDLNNTGVSDSLVPDTNKTFMKFYAGGPIYSSAVYHDKKIFFGSDTNKVHAVEVSTGLELWNNTTGAAVQATPLIVDDVLYVGSMDRSMYAFNVTTGEELWTFQTEGEIVSSAKYHEGNIFFGSYGRFNISSFTFDGKLYALNASTGLQEWNFTVRDQVWSSPAINDGSVYFGALDGNIYCVWASNGTLRWNYSSGLSGEDVYSSPAVKNGRVYVGMAYQMTQTGAMIALNASTGALEWEFPTGGFVYSSPAVDGGMIFFGTSEEPWNGDSYIYGILDDPNDNGMIDASEIMWRVVSLDDHEGGSSPVVADGRVVFGSNEGQFIGCLNETDGNFIWNLSTDTGPLFDDGIVTSPLVADGKIFVGSKNGLMYGIGSLGLPLLEIDVIPESSSVKGGQTLKISFLVTNNSLPVEGAFISVSVTDGSLTQSGFSTFEDGTQSVKFVAPVVEANLTVTITAEVAKYGFDDGIASEVITVEPAEKYVVDTTDNLGEYLVKYSPFIVAVVVLVVLNLLILIILRRRKKSGMKENVDGNQGRDEERIGEDSD